MSPSDLEFHTKQLRLLKGALSNYEQWVNNEKQRHTGVSSRSYQTDLSDCKASADAYTIHAGSQLIAPITSGIVTAMNGDHNQPISGDFPFSESR
jgi:hypothetical protein